MQFWLGVVAGLSIGWLFDWLAGRRALRASQAPADDPSELQDASAPSSPEDVTVTAATTSANDDDAVNRDTVDALTNDASDQAT